MNNPDYLKSLTYKKLHQLQTPIALSAQLIHLSYRLKEKLKLVPREMLQILAHQSKDHKCLMSHPGLASNKSCLL